jgi:lipopolysaccharide export system permease protein
VPIALAISAAFVYHRFNESNQLIALQAAGFSPRVMLTPLLQMITIVVGYLYVSNAYVSPNAWREFRSIEFNIKNSIDPPEKTGAIFSNNGFSVYAQKYIGDFFFGNLFIVDARNSEKVYSYFAKSGTIKDNILILTNGERIEVDFLTRQNSVMHFQSYHCDLKKILKVQKKSAQPNEKYLNELLQKCEDESLSKIQKALFHQKITSPLLAGIFPIISFLLIMLAPYTRKHSSFRMTLLIAIVVLFQGSYFWIANAAAKTPQFNALNYALIIFSIVALVAIAKKM